MTIEQFDNYEFRAFDVVVYKGKEYSIVAVEFEERLIAIDECNDEEPCWKRCENVEVFKSKQSNQ